MPKGKAKRDNPGLYQGSPEPAEANVTRQSTSHRRGGTHKVRDENRTDSVYDACNYKELVDTAKERGIYRKDMKKVEMAWALKHDDEDRKRAEHDALLARQRSLDEAKKQEERNAAERQNQIAAKRKRKIERARKRERDESVSDNTVSDADLEEEENTRVEYNREKFGEVLSDDSWDSTSTESSAVSVDRVFERDCRLRLFEWPYEKMPMHTLKGASCFRVFLEPIPCHVLYASIKIITTSSKQKIILPGSKYPPGVNPDFVPLLNPLIRSAARNGHLLGPLRKASIERGTDWAKRTLVQGWNAYMYFHLGSRNETKVLADTYNKWYLENRRLLRVKGKGTADPVDRAARHAQRQRNKAKKTAEVYEASQFRPLAMCYVPAYLDYGQKEQTLDGTSTLENLYFIRFPGCDVPHYYFWVREGEWDDPTLLNAAWEPEQPKYGTFVGTERGEDAEETDRPRKRTKRMRTRKSTFIVPSTPVSSSPPNITETIALVERQLHSNGLLATLSHYRQKWLANGKDSAWETLAAALPRLWPSGDIPNAPPVQSKPGVNVAVKLATIDHLKENGETPFSPLNGNEAWTRGDES